MKDKAILRAHASAFVGYAISQDVAHELDIVNQFSDNPDEYMFLSAVALVLTKLAHECIQEDPDFVEQVNKFFNNLLCKEEI